MKKQVLRALTGTVIIINLILGGVFFKLPGFCAITAQAGEHVGSTVTEAGDAFRAAEAAKEAEKEAEKNGETSAAETAEAQDAISAETADVQDYSSFWPAGPEINGDSAIVIDVATGLILYSKNMFDLHYPASTTKIMTTLVALENSKLNETITVSYEADNYVSKTSSRAGLVEGEQLSMEDALYAVMLESANEGTYAVGEHVADGSIAKFIKMMNNKAKELGCVNTHFANSHGLHDEEHYTCAYDLALIALEAWKYEDFRKITGARVYEMHATNKNPAKIYTNHHKFINKEVSYDYCIGGKTGATTQAGNCLVSYAKKDGMTIISVVMHSATWDNVYQDTKTLLNFAFDNYSGHRVDEVRLNGAKTFPSLFAGAEAFERNPRPVIHISEDGYLVLPNVVSPELADGGVSLERPGELAHGDNVIGHIKYTFGGRTISNAQILFYNSESPITAQVFEEKWPRFMVPVSAAFPSPTPTAIPEEEAAATENKEESKYGVGKHSAGDGTAEETAADSTEGEASVSPTPLPTGTILIDETKKLEPGQTVANSGIAILEKTDGSHNKTENTEETEKKDIRPLLLAGATFVIIVGLGFTILFRKPKRGETHYYK